MRITRVTRGGVYRPSGAGLDQVADDGGMDGGGDFELQTADDLPDADISDPMRIRFDTREAVLNVTAKPFLWLDRSSRRDRFTRHRYRYLSQLFDAPEPHVTPIDHDEDFRRPERQFLQNFARALKYRMIKRKRQKNQNQNKRDNDGQQATYEGA